jgi:hypothetical protein
MHLNLKDMEQQENDPSSGRNNVISPEEVEVETSLDVEEVQIEEAAHGDEELLDEEDTFLEEDDGNDGKIFNLLQ